MSDHLYSPKTPTLSIVGENPRRHINYYIFSGNVVFSVGPYLYRVHSYFFERESSHFRRLLAGSFPLYTSQGSSDLNPIVIDDVTHQDFDHLLWVFYNPLYSLYDASVSTWGSLLRVASMWGFHEVKDLSVRQLQSKDIPPVERIALYNRYGVDPRMLDSPFLELVARENPLTLRECKDLGIEVTRAVTNARELARRVEEDKNGIKSRVPAPIRMPDNEILSMLWEYQVSTSSNSGAAALTGEDTATKITEESVNDTTPTASTPAPSSPELQPGGGEGFSADAVGAWASGPGNDSASPVKGRQNRRKTRT